MNHSLSMVQSLVPGLDEACAADDVMVAAWLRKCGERSIRTATEYERAIKPFRLWLYRRSKALSGVNWQDMADWRDLQMAQVSPATVRTRLAIAASALTFGHTHFSSRYPNNAGGTVTAPRVAPKPAAEWMKLVNQAWAVVDGEPDPRRKLAFKTLLLTGCRRSEVAGMRWRCLVELQPCKWILEFVGKGGELQRADLDLSHAAELCALRGDAHDDELIFGVGESMLARWVREAAARVGAVGFTCHSLRHACATMLKQSGMSDDEVVSIMRWKSRSVLSLYQHYSSGVSAGSVLLKQRAQVAN